MIRRTALSLVISGLMTSAYAATIEVNTFVDEDGENSAACSLREAVKASELKQPYGGCTAGKRFETDVVQLQSGEYSLTRGELQPKSALTVRGKNSIDINQRDAITGVFDARLPLSTVIRPTNSRAFNTAVSRTNLTLQELIIDGGNASAIGQTQGGAVIVGANLSLRRVILRNNRATNAGGAIFLEGSQSLLNVEDTAFEGNVAARAAVLGMTCSDNLNLTSRNIEIQRSSIVNNGSATTTSVLDFCGIPNAKLTNTTIANNQVSDQASSATIVLLDDEFGTRTALTSLLDMTSVTLVGNQGGAGLLYDGRAQLRIVNSIVAYNRNRDNLDCRYLSREGVRLNTLNGVTTRHNLIGGARVSPSTDPTITFEQIPDLPLSRRCQLPSNVDGIPLVRLLPSEDPATTPRRIDYLRVTDAIDSNDSNRYTGSATQNSILYPLADYGVGLQGLLPVKISDPSQPSAVDRGAALNECGATDQRGVDRQSGVKNQLTNTRESPRCDIGALELGQITVNDDGDGANGSYVEQLETKRFDFTDEQLADLTADERALVARITADEERFKQQFKANFSFRRAFVDVFANDVPQESVDERTNPPTSRFVERYSGEYQVVDVESFGTGPDVLLSDQTPIKSPNADVVKCVWIEDMKRMAVFRTDGLRTPSGDVERCRYTVEIRDDSGSVTRSTGVVQTRIANIRPIAKDDSYTLQRGQESLTFDILANDNDDGDGPFGSLHEPDNRTPFFSGGDQVNIKIKKAPVLGRLVFEREAQCPDNTATRPNEICYGGRVKYLVDNTFSPFNDSFEYVVLDQDRAESNVATVEIINTATTTEDTRRDRQGIFNGGGSWGLWGLLSLVGLATLAQRRRRV